MSRRAKLTFVASLCFTTATVFGAIARRVGIKRHDAERAERKRQQEENLLDQMRQDAIRAEMERDQRVLPSVRGLATNPSS
ncbi:hypothetical protein CXG81DRAFT_27265 [Caulochytrium protostelioides]|uniref:Uncharacterized protein n=1 Tax=Caulochytrium protostelioides TaxID=1555241 RepID=A0A4P9X4M7_9FUNG|nr:hypothetical protein CXG81DRAFT_27265 [Caulochytrium protostelioides]|eukprot:RKP00020.1 hypothetical protein CXG81DRAFT_27265 [Caulochytrium protostelioides]